MMTKGFSKRDVWDNLMDMSGLVRLPRLACSQPSVVKPAQLCMAVPASFSAMTITTDYPPVGGDPDSKERVRAFVDNLEENIKKSRTSAATESISAEAVA